MGVTVHINDTSKKARIHEDDCSRLLQHGGGKNGFYQYFGCYEEAEEYLSDEYDDYDWGDCFYCNPENERCTDSDY